MLKNIFTNIGKKIGDFWKKLKKSQRVILVAVSILMIIAIIVVLSVSNRTEYTALFSGMESAEAGEVLQILQNQNVDAKVSNGSIMVPAEKADELRLQLNAQGYPKVGLNYSLYLDNASTFGMTDTEKKNIYQMQLQQNIAQTLCTMSKIKSATVMVSLAPDSKYVLSKDENQAASASVTLQLENNEELTTSEAQTVRAVVAKSVPGLEAENITIADTNMNRYEEDDGTNPNLGTDVVSQLQLTEIVRKQLEQQLLTLYAPVFGAQRLAASVNVTLDFDKSTTQSIQLSPVTDYGDENNMGIATEIKRTRERILNGAGAEGEPGVEPNGGGNPTYQADDDEAGDSTYYKVTEEYNARVNEINETLEKAQGQIKDISCTLIIDGGDELTSILPDIQKQISTAIGVPLNNVTVTAQEFYKASEDDDPNNPGGNLVPGEDGQQASSLIWIVAAVAVALIVLVIILMGRRSKKKQQEIDELQRRWMEEQQRQNAASSIDLAADDELTPEDLLRPQESDDLTQIKNLVETDPEAIAQLLRNWLSNDYSRR